MLYNLLTLQGDDQPEQPRFHGVDDLHGGHVVYPLDHPGFTSCIHGWQQCVDGVELQHGCPLRTRYVSTSGISLKRTSWAMQKISVRLTGMSTFFRQTLFWIIDFTLVYINLQWILFLSGHFTLAYTNLFQEQNTVL